MREPFDKQHGKRAQALLKPASLHLYEIYWSMWSWLSWKRSLLLTCQILELVVNTLAANEKYPVLTRDNLTIPIQMQLSQNQKTFSHFFASFLKSRINFKYFGKNMTLIDFVFPKLRPPKTWSDKCLKSPVSEDPSTSNIVNVPKHCRNLNLSPFNIFIDHYQVNWVWKWVSYGHANTWDCFLTHWLPKKSMLFLIKTI